jgi:hypothetical protein
MTGEPGALNEQTMVTVLLMRLNHSVTVAAFFAMLATSASLMTAAQTTPGHAGFGGIWVISPDARLRGPDAASLPTGRPDRERNRSAGGGRRGAAGGGGGFGSGGGRAGRGEDNADERAAIANYSRTLLAPAKQMTIVVHDTSLSIAYDDGRTLTLDATNKTVSGRAENGFVKLTRKSKWEGDTLVSHVEIENGPKFDEKYELIADGGELRVSVTTECGGGRGGSDGKRTIMHVYERPAP